MRFLVSGGGTGGHVYPVLAVVAEIRKQKTEPVEILYLGRAGAIEERLAGQAQVPFQSIKVEGVRGLAPWKSISNFVGLLKSIGRVREIIRTFKPESIFATGGYVSAPVIWAGAAEHVPSVIYLPDLEPGWAIRATFHWATRIAVSFEEVARYFPESKTVVTGYPVRPEFFLADRASSRRAFHLDPNANVVTVLGGSRGAHSINHAAVSNLAALSKLAQIVHITGSEDEAWVNAQVQALSSELSSRVRVCGYLDEQLPSALAAADAVVARAGAATLGEFPALGLPAVLVPYPHAGRHQEKNAEFLVSRGAAVRVSDETLGADLVPVLSRLLSAPEQLKKMSVASRALAQPEAAANLARLLDARVSA